MHIVEAFKAQEHGCNIACFQKSDLGRWFN